MNASAIWGIFPGLPPVRYTTPIGVIPSEEGPKPIRPGDEYADLVVLRLSERREKSGALSYWTCRCKLCNNRIDAHASHLRSGTARNCGCRPSRSRTPTAGVLRTPPPARVLERAGTGLHGAGASRKANGADPTAGNVGGVSERR